MGFSIWDCKMSLNHCENGETKGVRTCFVLKSVPLTCSIFARFPMSGGFTIWNQQTSRISGNLLQKVRWSEPNHPRARWKRSNRNPPIAALQHQWPGATEHGAQDSSDFSETKSGSHEKFGKCSVTTMVSRCFQGHVKMSNRDVQLWNFKNFRSLQSQECVVFAAWVLPFQATWAPQQDTFRAQEDGLDLGGRCAVLQVKYLHITGEYWG